jgi:hypothetical protein
MNDNLGNMAKCSLCGKKYFIVDKKQWVYKHRGKYLCSYTCYSQMK